MRLQITHMKAPWPAGAKVGDVLELPAIPAWALGKCRQVGDDVATTDIEQRRLIQAVATLAGDGSGDPLPPIDPLPVVDEPKAKSKK